MSSCETKRRKQRVCVEPYEGGLALSVDGTFASWYEPGASTTRGVWDALAAPLLLLPPERRSSVLVLGLGGGSAARVVRALAPDATITGVEYDAEVVAAARKHFDLDDLHMEVIVADAREFLLHEKRRFDLIIDDIFIGNADDVHKPRWMIEGNPQSKTPRSPTESGKDFDWEGMAEIPWPHSGIALALRLLAPDGIFSCNSIDEAPQVQRLLCKKLPHLLCTRVFGYDNRIFAGSSRPLAARALRQSMRRDALLASTLSQLSLQTIR